jgi:hypothetical protein
MPTPSKLSNRESSCACGEPTTVEILVWFDEDSEPRRYFTCEVHAQQIEDEYRAVGRGDYYESMNLGRNA